MFSKPAFQKTLLACAVPAWLLLALFALGWTEKIDVTAGAAAHPPVRLQKPALAALGPHKPTLIMLVHPQCPCSRASLTELSRLAALCPNRANISVLFLRPAGCPDAVAAPDLRRPGARGHDGDTAGWAPARARRRGAPGPSQSPVYGCPMTADRTPARCKMSRGGIAWLP